MKAFVTGVGGQLGYDVFNELKSRGVFTVGSDILRCDNVDNYVQLDITDSGAVESIITREDPDVVFHCAAWTAVDDAEDEDNKDKVMAANVYGTQNIALACKKINSKMIYISTDYVFNGEGEAAWKPDCESFEPLNVYGRSKLDGERCVADLLEKYFIVRVEWIFGKNGINFVNTMLDLGKKTDTVRVVSDQIGTPTYTHDLAKLLADMAQTEKYGIYHASNEGGYISRYDFACEIFKQADYNIRVIPVTTRQYGLSKAIRPLNSRLDKSKLAAMGFETLPTWQDALSRYLMEIEY